MTTSHETQFVILGCLSIRPMSVLEIEQFIAGVIVHFSRATQEDLRSALDDLSEENLVHIAGAGVCDSGESERFVIAPAGAAMFSDWLSGRSDWMVSSSERMLKLFFVLFQSEEASTKRLNVSQEECEKMLALFAEAFQQLKEDPMDDRQKLFIELCLDYGVYVLKAKLSWCDLAKKKIEAAEAVVIH